MLSGTGSWKKSWKGKRKEFQKDLEKMRVKIKSERIERTESGKETGSMDCSETEHRGPTSAQAIQQSSEERQGWGGHHDSSCYHSGHNRVCIQIKTQTETEHKAIQKVRKKKVDCSELSSGGGGRHSRAANSSSDEKEQRHQKRREETRRNRKEWKFRQFSSIKFHQLLSKNLEALNNTGHFSDEFSILKG